MDKSRLMIALCGDLTLDVLDKNHLRHSAVGGVILFARNFADATQLRQLTADIRRHANKRIIIAVDQEGGRVRRFIGEQFSPLPPMRELAKTQNLLHDAGLVMAAELLAAGVDLSFAPVLDLDYGNSSVIGNRAFAADAQEAATAALAFADGMQAAGMACCGKHFPGHGFVAADSHTALPVDKRPWALIKKTDLIPFMRWAQCCRPALMTAHIIYEQCDAAIATYSSFWLQTILRDQLGYSGMIISDDLTMAGADTGDMLSRAQKATQAGCDGVLICKPSATQEILAAISADNVTENPWLALSPQPDNRICVGDNEYEQARKRLFNY